MYDRLGSRLVRNLGRAALRPSALDLRTQLMLILVLLAVLVSFHAARAEDRLFDEDDDTTTTTTTTVTTKTVKKGAAAQATPVPAESKTVDDFIMTSTFGSLTGTGTAGCKTDVLSKDVVKELKGDCKDWLNERKAELKGKYQTGTCQEECADCGMGLKRCAVNGTIHYRP